MYHRISLIDYIISVTPCQERPYFMGWIFFPVLDVRKFSMKEHNRICDKYIQKNLQFLSYTYGTKINLHASLGGTVEKCAAVWISIKCVAWQIIGRVCMVGWISGKVCSWVDQWKDGLLDGSVERWESWWISGKVDSWVDQWKG